MLWPLSSFYNLAVLDMIFDPSDRHPEKRQQDIHVLFIRPTRLDRLVSAKFS